MIHTTVGIYNNGDYVVNGVKSENLAFHIAFNLSNRPGRSLVVDGVIIHAGYMGWERTSIFLKQNDIKPATQDTAPYQ